MGEDRTKLKKWQVIVTVERVYVVDVDAVDGVQASDMASAIFTEQHEKHWPRVSDSEVCVQDVEEVND